jgi:hypothetical protein
VRRKGLHIPLAVVAFLLVASPHAAAQAPPTITQPPSILPVPEARVGNTLLATPGDWTPQGNVTPTYQWLRCSDSSVESCDDIDGATNPFAYQVADQDRGERLRIRLTVTRDGETDTDYSGSTDPVPEAPSNTVPPTISGDAREGRVLTASPGDWRGTPPPTLDLVWERCVGDDCTPVQAGSVEYMLSDADVGRTVRVAVTATNSEGSSTATSPRTERVARAPLLNTAPPTIAGIAAVDQSLTATPGQWESSGPIDFVYRWLRCRGDASCDPIPGADSATYQVRLLDVGLRLRVRVTAIGDGGAGSETRESALTGVVPAPAGVLPFTQSGGTPAVRPSAAFMRPFPRVRIKGYYTPMGAVVQLLTVKRAAGARIGIVCRGPDCPFRRRVHRGRQRVRFRSLERTYRGGTRLTFRITKAGLIGKYARIVIRENRPPKRRDRCLMPGSTKPVRCPLPE